MMNRSYGPAASSSAPSWVRSNSCGSRVTGWPATSGPQRLEIDRSKAMVENSGAPPPAGRPPRSPSASVSVAQARKFVTAAWESSTPLGRPVDPEVNSTYAVCAGSRSRAGAVVRFGADHQPVGVHLEGGHPEPVGVPRVGDGEADAGGVEQVADPLGRVRRIQRKAGRTRLPAPENRGDQVRSPRQQYGDCRARRRRRSGADGWRTGWPGRPTRRSWCARRRGATPRPAVSPRGAPRTGRPLWWPAGAPSARSTRAAARCRSSAENGSSWSRRASGSSAAARSSRTKWSASRRTVASSNSAVAYSTAPAREPSGCGHRCTVRSVLATVDACRSASIVIGSSATRPVIPPSW